MSRGNKAKNQRGITMKTIIKNKEYEVKKTGNRFYYWSNLAVRWLPVAKDKVIFD